MTNIYRIINTNKSGVKEVYIFNYESKNKDYKKDITKELAKYKKGFGSENYKEINTLKKKQTIKVYLINDNIFLDDSIDIIKKKIIKATGNKFSYQEIYLFGLVNKMFLNDTIFELLSQNSKLEITQARLIEYILNFSDIDIDKLNLDKEIYNYNDIIELNIDKLEKLVKIPIGQKFYGETEYPTTINPYDVLKYDKLILNFNDDIITTQNKNLLLNYPSLYENNIFLSTTEDVIEYIKDYDIPVTPTLNIFFPLLSEEGINSIETWKEKRGDLIKQNKQRLTTTFNKRNEQLLLFNDIQNDMRSDKKSQSIEYSDVGVSSIKFIVHQNNKVIIPVDLMFKLLKTSQDTPFIKFNPGKGREKIYRLFSEKTAVNGKKIPYLDKATILRLRGNIAKQKCVACYILANYNVLNSDNEENKENEENNIIPIVISLFDNADIQFELETNKLIDIEDCEKLCNIYGKKLLGNTEEYLKEHGYNIDLFDSFKSDNTTVEKMNYVFKTPIKRNINMNNYKCFSSLFNIIEGDLRENINMRYKRVSYFNKMDSIDAYMTELINMGTSRDDLIKQLINNFDLTQDQAISKYVDWIRNIQVEQQMYENRKLRVKSNPGFPVTIIKDKFKNNITITIGNVNNVKYIELLKGYIDVLLKMTQDITNIKVSKTRINRLCSINLKDVDDITPDKDSKISISLEKQQNYNLNDVDELGDDEGLLGLLDEGEYEDYYENTDDIIIGGKTRINKNSSSSNITDDDSEGELLDLEFEEGDELLEFEDESDKSEEFDLLDLEEGSILSDEEEQEQQKDNVKDTLQGIKETDKQSEKVKTKKTIEDDNLLETDVAGLPLSNPNYFFQRMYDRDKKLFLKNKDGKFNAYSRICPHNVRRQPVILTDEEKENIDKKNPGSYDHAIKYGSTPDNQYWYICPRFWCLKTNTSMTEAQVKAGECGGSTKIIPRDAKKVPKDAFVFEFNADSEHKDTKGEYIQHYPGFVKSGSHPDDLCIPCCFKSWDSKSQKERRDICLANKKLEKKTTDIVNDDYIKNSDKYPLEKGRWGYLPINVQKILHTNNEKCKDHVKNTIKPFVYCLLRKGVEINKTQSFIGVLSDLYVDYANVKLKKKILTPSIQDMKQIILMSLTVDLFISYFNGSLVDMFHKDSLTVNIEEYNESNIYKKLVKNKRTKELKKIIASYENFRDYMNDDNVVIDHTFLWDIVSKPNKNLFTSGLNLAILEITENDITDNIELLCPTNNYSNEIFSSKKPTTIILKRGEFYEPIYIYRDEQKGEPVVQKLFSNYNSYLVSNIKEILEIVKTTYSKCKPLPSMPRIYKFKNNINLVDTNTIIKKHKMRIVHQIVNYNNSVIGVIIQYKEKTKKEYKYGFLPIEPSSIDNKLSFSFNDSDTITFNYIEDNKPEGKEEKEKEETINLWGTLVETLEFLKYMKKTTKNTLLCNPVLKIEEDGLIVGIITETNQFIPLIDPEENIKFDELETVTGYNYLDIDDKLLLNDNIDKERVKMVNTIKLENSFYNSFRSTVKQVINKYENIEFKKELEYLSRELIPYHRKIEIIQKKIRDFMKPYIEFVMYKDDLLHKLGDLTSCVSNKKCDKKQYCLETKEDTCKLLIPDKHLLSGNDNEEIYYYRMSDEIIRYGKINNFIFKPSVYLSFNKLNYNLGEDEIILLDTLLIDGYFEDLTEAHQNKYISHNSVEFIQPNKAPTYNNYYDYKEFLNPNVEERCKTRTINNIRGNWGGFFKPSFKELQYKDNVICSFDILQQIINDFTNGINMPSISDLKKILISGYTKLIDIYGPNKIVWEILKDQGKEKLTRQVMEDKITFKDMILSDLYYITNLDILILSEHYKIPIIIIAGSELYELKQWKQKIKGKFIRKMWITNDAMESNYYYIIKQPGIKRNKIPKYSIIYDNEKIKTNKTELLKKFINNIIIYKLRPSIDEYITTYKSITKK